MCVSVCCDLCGRFYLSIDREMEGIHHLRSCYRLSQQWGCVIKPRQLKEEFPSIFADYADMKEGRKKSPSISSDIHSATQIPKHKRTKRSRSSQPGSKQEQDHPTKRPRQQKIATDKQEIVSEESKQETTETSASPSSSFSSSSSPTSTSLANQPDLTMIMRACTAFSVEKDLNRLHRRLMMILLQHAGATRCCLIVKKDKQNEEQEGEEKEGEEEYQLGQRQKGKEERNSRKKKYESEVDAGESSSQQACPEDNEWRVEVQAEVNTPSWSSAATSTIRQQETTNAATFQSDSESFDGSMHVETYGESDQTRGGSHPSPSLFGAVPLTVFRMVQASHSPLLLSHSQLMEHPFNEDPYFLHRQHEWHHKHPDINIDQFQLQSCLCAPLLRQSELDGVLYLENEHTAGAFTFTSQHVDVLQSLCIQAVLSRENARLYAKMSKAKEEAEQGSRSKSEFLANMSHEIRTVSHINTT